MATIRAVLQIANYAESYENDLRDGMENCGPPCATWKNAGASLALSNRAQDERRKWNRVPIAIPIFVHGGEPKKYVEFGTAVNISAGGLLVAVRKFVPLLERIMLEVPSSPLPESALSHFNRTMSGRVVRVEAAENHNLLAVQFDTPLV